MSDRSSRAERRAAKIRNQRILIVVIIILILATIIFIALGGLDKLSMHINGITGLPADYPDLILFI